MREAILAFDARKRGFFGETRKNDNNNNSNSSKSSNNNSSNRRKSVLLDLPRLERYFFT